MKKLTIAIAMFISIATQAQEFTFLDTVRSIKEFTVEDLIFTLTPFGVSKGSFYLTITEPEIDSGSGKIWVSWDGVNDEGSLIEFTFKKNKRIKINFSSLVTSENKYQQFGFAAKFGGGGIGINGGLYGMWVTTPEIRNAIVKNNAISTTTLVEVISEIISSNLDELISYIIKDDKGTILFKEIDTTPATVEAVTKQRKILIDFNKYPTAKTLTCITQTSGQTTMKLQKLTPSSVVSVSPKTLTDETQITIFNISGQNLGITTWGEEIKMSRDGFYKSETMTRPKRKPVVVF